MNLFYKISVVIFYYYMFIKLTKTTSIGSEVKDLIQCSKYDFEEKVLEKLVDLKYKMEKFEIIMGTYETEVKSGLDLITERSADVVKAIESVQNKTDSAIADVNTKTERILSNLQAKVAVMENMSKNHVSESDLKLNDSLKQIQFDSAKLMENYQTKLNDSMRDVYNLSKNLISSTERRMFNEQSRLNNSIKILGNKLELTVEEKLNDLESRQNKLETDHFARLNETVGFAAYSSSSQTVKNHEPVVFDKVWTNKGNAYDPKTGVFTAPHFGLYHISSVVLTGSTQIYFHIYHNGQQRSGSWINGKNGLNSWTLDLVLDLQVGDRVYVSSGYSPHTIYSDSNNYITFSGHSIP